ncbi:hypothetical protein AB0M44_02505, partial [Streptosporangium subroseum]|uniref:hypothetical protein n=1 Tax=Streptosporangium subroseum TaxID=106412 RepID=UPI00341BFBD1
YPLWQWGATQPSFTRGAWIVVPMVLAAVIAIPGLAGGAGLGEPRSDLPYPGGPDERFAPSSPS